MFMGLTASSFFMVFIIVVGTENDPGELSSAYALLCVYFIILCFFTLVAHSHIVYSLPYQHLDREFGAKVYSYQTNLQPRLAQLQSNVLASMASRDPQPSASPGDDVKNTELVHRAFPSILVSSLPVAIVMSLDKANKHTVQNRGPRRHLLPAPRRLQRDRRRPRHQRRQQRLHGRFAQKLNPSQRVEAEIAAADTKSETTGARGTTADVLLVSCCNRRQRAREIEGSGVAARIRGNNQAIRDPAGKPAIRRWRHAVPRVLPVPGRRGAPPLRTRRHLL